MRAPVPLALLAGLLFAASLGAPTADATGHGGPDHVLVLDAGAAPRWIGPPGPFILDESAPGTRFTWTFDVAAPYTVLELRIAADAFDVARAKQVQPRVEVSETHYPLFVPYPRPELWAVESPAQVYHLHTEDNAHVLRLGFAGPLVGTFVLEKDVTAPVFTLGDVEEVTHKGFYQETTTDEPAIGELRVRPSGSTEDEVLHPTPQFAYLQRFPIQGLDPDRGYDVLVRFTDWSDNVATTDTYTVRTPPRPIAVPAVIRPLSPEPNATYVLPDTTILAGIEGPAPDSIEQVRLFVDLSERTTGWTLSDGVLRYTHPAPFETGVHRVAVEVLDAYGNKEHVQWRFWVGMAPAEEQAPGVALVPLTVFLVLVVALARRP